MYSSLLCSACMTCLMLYSTIINNQVLNKIKVVVRISPWKDVYISMTNVWGNYGVIIKFPKTIHPILIQANHQKIYHKVPSLQCVGIPSCLQGIYEYLQNWAYSVVLQTCTVTRCMIKEEAWYITVALKVMPCPSKHVVTDRNGRVMQILT